MRDADVRAERRLGEQHQRALNGQRLALNAQEEIAVATERLQRLPLLPRGLTDCSVRILPAGDPVRDLLATHFVRSTTRHRGPKASDPHRGTPMFDIDRIEKLCCPLLQEAYTARLQEEITWRGGRFGPANSVAFRARTGAVRVQSCDSAYVNEALLYHGAPSVLCEIKTTTRRA